MHCLTVQTRQIAWTRGTSVFSVSSADTIPSAVFSRMKYVLANGEGIPCIVFIDLETTEQIVPRLLSPDNIFHRVRRQDFEHHLRAEDEAFDEEIMVVFDREINLGLRSGVEQGFLLRG